MEVLLARVRILALLSDISVLAGKVAYKKTNGRIGSYVVDHSSQA